MTRPTRARIDIAAFVDNYRHAKALAACARAVAVVKADAYGHGAVELSRALAGEADAFGVACLEEAMELRASGVANAILLLEGVFTPDELVDVDREHMIQVVHADHQLQWLLDSRPQRPYRVWLKLDSGMHRLGFDRDGFRRAHAELAACAHVGEIVHMTHFARADETDIAYTQQQLSAFHDATRDLEHATSVANSPATLAWPATRSGWVRPGIMLYGASPLQQRQATDAALRPVMRLESAIIAMRTLAAGDAVGYGGRFVCEQATRIGVVAIGYGDGYPRHATDGTPVMVDGIRTRIVGRVSMDMLTVDLGPVPHAHVGSLVELWGPHVSANEVARYADTIAYELFTGVTRRVPRVYAAQP